MSNPGQGKSVIQEVKYSLRELLDEVEEERSLSMFARETVDQEEIGKLFAKKRTKGRKRAPKRKS